MGRAESGLDITITDSLRRNILSPDMAAYLWSAIDNRSSILVAGTYEPRTQMLGVLSKFINPNTKVVTTELTPELYLYNKNWLRLVGSVTPYMYSDIMHRALPDYVVVGELDAGNANMVTQGVSDGFPVLAGIRGESIPGVFHFLTSPSTNVPRTLVASYNIIALQKELRPIRRGTTRTTHITEILGLDTRTDEFITNDVYRYDPASDSHAYAGRSYDVERRARKKGVSTDESKQDLERRRVILEWLLKKDIREDSGISETINSYSVDAEELFKKASAELM